MTKFKKDDKVRIKDGVIDEINNAYNHVPYAIRFKNGSYGSFIEEDLELIAPEEPTHPITPENIEEVLIYNDFHGTLITSSRISLSKSVHIYFDNPRWLQHLEVETGKLKGLPMPKHEPHWVIVKDGVEIGKIVASKIEFNHNPDNKSHLYHLCINELIPNAYAYSPLQYKGEESDFTILFNDGSVAYAKWVK